MYFYDIINEYNSTSRSPNPGQVRSNAKFYSPGFYRKYENNNQVLASFGQTASTTKLVQVNWEKLKHLKSCLFVLCCQIQIDFQYLTENTFQG